MANPTNIIYKRRAERNAVKDAQKAGVVLGEEVAEEPVEEVVEVKEVAEVKEEEPQNLISKVKDKLTGLGKDKSK